MVLLKSWLFNLTLNSWCVTTKLCPGRLSISGRQAGLDGVEMERVPMTADGYARLGAELKRLKTEERPSIIKAISAAREHGDLSENAEYHAARERQSFVEGRVRELEDKMSRAEVIDVSKLSGKQIKFGATVTLADEETDEKKTYQLVGADEADVNNGRLSITSPVARALIGRAIGDSVHVNTPNGSRSYEVMKINYR